MAERILPNLKSRITLDTSELAKAKQDGDTVKQSLQGIGSGADESQAKVNNLLTPMRVAGSIASAYVAKKIFDFGKAGFDELGEAQAALAQTNAALTSTGGAANVTAEDVTGLAGSLSKLSGVDDEVIQKGENMLLTFTKVRNEVGAGNQVFDRATTAALDLSTAGFGSVESASVMLGKALNDPLKGITALGRAGVTFTAEQKALIASLVESGDVLGAQKIILAEVETQVGGSAKAFGETLPGQIAKAKNAGEEMKASLVQGMAPALELGASAAATAASAIAELPEPIAGAIGGVALLGGGFVALARPVNDAITLIRTLRETTAATNLASLGGQIAGLAGPAGLVIAGFGALALATGALGNEQADTAEAVTSLTEALANQSKEGIRQVNENIAKLLTTAAPFPDVFTKAGASLAPFIASLRSGEDEMLEVRKAMIDLGHSGNDFTLDNFKEAMDKGTIASTPLTEELRRLVESGALTDETFGHIITNLRVGAEGFAKAAEEAKILDTAQQGAAEAGTDLAQTTGELSGAEEELAEQTDAAAKALDEYKQALDEATAAQDGLIGSHLSLAEANIRAEEAIDKVTVAQEAANAATGTDAVQAQRDLESALLDAVGAHDNVAQAAADEAEALAIASGKAFDASDKHGVYIAKLGELAAGLAPGSPVRVRLEGYIAELASLPPQVTTNITTHGFEEAEQLAIRLAGALGAIPTDLETFVSPGGQRFRQHGGRVWPGEAFVVGEKRPELFVPDTTGTIYPSVPQAFGAANTSGGTTVIEQHLHVADEVSDFTRMRLMHDMRRIAVDVANERLRSVRTGAA